MKLGVKNELTKIFQRLRMRWLTTSYLFDKPSVLYQPLPWCGIETAKRDFGSYQRLRLIENELDGIKASVLDVGSSVGFFSISLAERGYFVTGLEMGKNKLEISQCAAAIAGVKTVSFVNIEVTIESALLLPTYDVVLCLSVWHHWVLFYWFDEAMSILQSLWSRTKNCMFFDTGLEELPSYFNLPKIDTDPVEWLTLNLQSICQDSTVKILGVSNAFPSEQFYSKDTKKESATATRNLFCIKRRI